MSEGAGSAGGDRRSQQADEAIDRLQQAHALGRLVGGAPSFRNALARLPAIARADATVLLAGETGTGKELVARAIHYLSPRRRASFTAVNCGALPETLLEDELFGHERGAFTDAKQSRGGLLQQAHGGTLLLDEVDSLSPRAQVSLLRVLQDRSYRALGSAEERHVDVRIIAATNVDLFQLVTERSMRSDLYYRLGVLTLTLPPLRERSDDVLPLAFHFLLRMTHPERGALRFGADAKSALLAHDWPGNVRELENAVLRGVSLCEGDTIHAVDLGLRSRAAPRYESQSSPASVETGTSPSAPATLPARAERTALPPPAIDLSRSFGDLKRETLTRFEKDYLVVLLQACRGNVSHAARRARKERRDFRRLLRKHDVDPRTFEPERV